MPSETTILIGVLATFLAAIIAAAAALTSAYLTYQGNHYRSELEKIRIEHEKQKWLLELHAQLESRLHEIRLRVYPEILAELERLSHFRVDAETWDSLRELAEKINRWGYGETGLCMSDGTRIALFKLRYELSDYINRQKRPDEALMRGIRTDVAEWLRRDVNHSVSTWRSLPTLLSEIQKAVERSDGDLHATTDPDRISHAPAS